MKDRWAHLNIPAFGIELQASDKPCLVDGGRGEWAAGLYLQHASHAITLVADEAAAEGTKELTRPQPITKMRSVNAALIGKLVRVKVRRGLRGPSPRGHTPAGRTLHG
jgi:hypothetical protein